MTDNHITMDPYESDLEVKAVHSQALPSSFEDNSRVLRHFNIHIHGLSTGRKPEQRAETSPQKVTACCLFLGQNTP